MIANGNAIITLKTLQTQLSSWYTYVTPELNDAETVSKLNFPIPPVPFSVEEFKKNIFELATNNSMLQDYKRAQYALFDAGKHRIDASKSLLDLEKLINN